MATKTGAIRYRRFTQDDAMKVREAHESGATINAIRNRFGVATYKAVKRLIVRAGGVPNTRPKPESAREKKYPGVWVVSRSKNRKLGECSSTAVAKQSCPIDCAFRGAGCYAEFGQTAIGWKRITKAGAGMTPVELAKVEASAIRSLPAKRPLRLHTAGDSTTREGTQAIASACADYVNRGLANGERVVAFTYTHAWRDVPREDWGAVSVLASCESTADVFSAWSRGYAAALVVDELPADGRTFQIGDGKQTLKIIPCPSMTRDRTCSSCRLCFDDQRLLDAKLVIGLGVHGDGAKRASAALRRIALPTIQVGEVHPQ